MNANTVNWFKKHVDTVVVLGGIITSFLWMINSLHSLKISMKDSMFSMENRIDQKIEALDKRIDTLDKRITVIETVLIMSGCNIKGIAANNIQMEGKNGK